MSNTKIHIVVMTCMEPWFLDAVESVNNQEIQPEGKHLLIDEKFLDDAQKERLESVKDVLDGWTVNVHNLDNNFAKHRNWMLERLPKSDEWVLFLDADEVIHSGFVSNAHSSIEYSDTYSTCKVDAYALAMIHTFEGRNSSPSIDWLNPNTMWYPDWHLRLFKNNPSVFFHGLVHEQVTGYQTIATSSDPKMTIIHSKTPEMQHLSDKRWRKLEIARREKDPNYLSHLQGDDWKNFINEFEENI